jgi:uncharacterized glyoxalase superfamily protein PhnB
MTRKCVPMIHVPDVRSTVDWYQGIGFDVIATYGDGGDGLSFAILSFGTGEVMFSSDGAPSRQFRREVDLYVYADDVDGIYERLKDRVDVVEGPHDTFYGMREVIVRDLNRFWITFGEPSSGELLMGGVAEGKPDVVRRALARGGLTPERLSAAIAAASGTRNEEIIRMLQDAGAVAPPALDPWIVRACAGAYKSDKGPSVRIVLQDGGLMAFPEGAPPTLLLPMSDTVFRTVEPSGGTLTFEVRDDMAIGLTFTQQSMTLTFKRVGEGAA